MAVENIQIQQLVDLSSSDLPLIDLRSHRQFIKGHIPGARHLHFNFDLRAVKQRYPKQLTNEDLQDLWIEKEEFLEQWQRLDHPELLIYDQTGGLRIRYFLELMQNTDADQKRIMILEGGYAGFLTWRDQSLSRKYPIAMLSGLTGSGKTELLRSLIKNGLQGLDLEEMAGHKGSAFGMQRQQPTNEQFQNNIAQKLSCFKPDKWILVEQKGKFLGQVEIPQILRRENAMLNIFLEVSHSRRLKRIMMTYANGTTLQLHSGLEKLQPRLDKSLYSKLNSLLKQNHLASFFKIMMDYYDQANQYQVPIESQKKTIKGDQLELQVEEILNSNVPKM